MESLISGVLPSHPPHIMFLVAKLSMYTWQN